METKYHSDIQDSCKCTSFGASIQKMMCYRRKQILKNSKQKIDCSHIHIYYFMNIFKK